MVQAKTQGHLTITDLTDITDVYLQYGLALANATVTNSYTFSGTGEVSWSTTYPTWVSGYQVWIREVTEKEGVAQPEYGTPFLDKAINQINNNVVALQTKTKYFWTNLTAHTNGSGGWTKPNYPVGTYAASGISGTTFDSENSNTYGYNTLYSNGIKLRYNAINLAELTGSSLIFYNPSTSSQGTKAMELTSSALKFYNPSSNTISMMDLTSSGLVFKTAAGTTIGTFGSDASGGLLDLSGRLNIKGGGRIGQDSDNYWEFGDNKSYNDEDSAYLIGKGTASIQLGTTGHWRLDSNRIHAGWYQLSDSSSSTPAGSLHFDTGTDDGSTYYWDYGMHYPNKAGGGNNKFLYIRRSNATTSTTLGTMKGRIDDDTYWTYKFYIDGNGNVHAPGFYIGDSSTPIGGGTGTVAEKLMSGAGSATQPVYFRSDTGHVGEVATTTYQLNAAGAKGVDTSISGSPTDNNVPTSLAVKTFVENKGYVTTDEKVKATSNNTTKYWLVGTTTNGTSTSTVIFDSNVYVDTTAGALHATTFNGYTLAAAAAKGVVTTLDTSANLPTANAVKTALNEYLPLTGGNVTGVVSFGDSVTIDEATIGDLVVNGGASFTNNLQANTINGVAVGSNPKFTDSEVSAFTLASDSGTSSITLAHGSKYKLTAGSKTIIFTMPASGNTDASVKQEASTTSEWRKVLLHYSTNSAGGNVPSTVTNQVYAAKGIEVQPSTGTLAATKFKGALEGNADTATAFSSSRTISLTGDVTGSASGTGASGWSINTTVGDDSHYHTMAYAKKPILSKIYSDTSYYATSTGSWETSSWYFISVKPDAWYKPWSLRLRIHSYCPDYSNIDSVTDSFITGRADSIAYSNYTERYDTAHYYIPYYTLKRAGFDAGLGHAIGISILYGSYYSTPAYYRTFEVDYFECENCTVTFLDTPVKWANWTNNSSTNYNGIGSLDAVTRGYTQTGDRNDVNYQNRIYYVYKKPYSTLYRYQIVLSRSDGTLLPVNNVENAPSNISKTLTTEEFDPFGEIYYYNTTTTRTTSQNLDNATLYRQVLADLRYSFNITNESGKCLTSSQPVYIVATPQTNGMAKLASPALTQSLPSTEDGKIYIYIGQAYPDTYPYRCELPLYHPIYWYKNGAIRQYVGDSNTVNGHTVGIDVPSNAVFTDTKYTAATAAPGKVASSSAVGTSTNYARQDHTHGIDLATGDSNGQVKIAGTNVSVKGLGSWAYKSSGSGSDVGLGNVTNNAQVKGLASGTTSGHLVTWGADGYTVTDSGVALAPSNSVRGIVSGVASDNDGKLVLTYADGSTSDPITVEFVATQTSSVEKADALNVNGVAIGSATVPVYFDNTGKPQTANTIPKLNNTTTGGAFYAPTTVGTNNYVLKSNGSGAPTWLAQSSIAAGTAGTFASAASVTLTGDTTGSASSTKGWSITTKTDRISTEGDNRTVATTPNDYTSNTGNKIIFRGLKTNSYIGSPSSNTYSYLVGLRGWSDNSGGNAHEIAFNDTGIFIRKGATTTWGNWEKIYTSGNLDKSTLGLGNVTNYDASGAISSITRSGTTFTYTTVGGGTGTFTQQDNNTTYSAGTGLSLSGTTFSNSGVTGVKGNSESSYRTGQVNLTPANIGAVATTGDETIAGKKSFSDILQIQKTIRDVAGQHYYGGAANRSRWYKITLAHNGVTPPATNQWYMCSMTIHVAGDYNECPRGTIELCYYIYWNGTNFLADKVYATGYGPRINKAKVYYTLADPFILYVDTINPYTSVWVDYVSYRDSAQGSNVNETKVEGTTEITVADYVIVPTTYVFTTDGNYIYASSHFRPSNNNSQNLGDSSYKWANIYATTFNGALNGNANTATTATTASKLGSSNVGSADRPIYLSSGTATQTTYRMAGTNVGATTALAISNDLDTGIWYVNGTSDIYSASDGAAYVNKYSNNWISEIYQDYKTGQIALRGKNNGTWQAWRKVLDSSNFNTWTPTLTGTGASGTWGISISGNAATATKATQDGNGDTITSTYIKKAGDAMTGGLAINASNSYSSYNEGLRINAGARTYATITIGGTNNSTAGITDGAFWIGVYNTGSTARRLMIAHNGSTGTNTYFYSNASGTISPWLHLGNSGTITSGNSDAVTGGVVYTAINNLSNTYVGLTGDEGILGTKIFNSGTSYGSVTNKTSYTIKANIKYDSTLDALVFTFA